MPVSSTRVKHRNPQQSRSAVKSRIPRRLSSVQAGGVAAPVGQPFGVPGRVSKPAKTRTAKFNVFDRLLRSRVWILLVAVLLVGLVALQVMSLKLNASISKSVERSATLEQSNAELKSEISRRLDPAAIRSAAAGTGLVAVDPNSVSYVSPGSKGSEERALTTLRDGITPKPTPAVAPTAPVTPQPVAATPVQPEPVTADQPVPASDQTAPQTPTAGQTPTTTTPTQQLAPSTDPSVGGASAPTTGQ